MAKDATKVEGATHTVATRGRPKADKKAPDPADPSVNGAEPVGDPLTILTLKNGAAVKLFDEALSKVLDNVKDERTGAKPRKVVLTVTVAPEDVEGFIIRDSPQVGIECDVKLAPITTGESTHRIVGRRGSYQLRLGL